MEKIRTFIAVPIPQAVKESITSLQGPLVRSQADIKWVRPDSIHITLKFLGDVESGRIPEVVRAIEPAVLAIRPFSVQIGGCGFFPNAKKPNVLWIGVSEGADALALLAQRIDDALSDIGFEREKRAFRSHLTIGRVRSTRHIEDAVSMLQSSPFDAGTFEARTVNLMKSDLRPEGAVYTPLFTFNLQG